MGQDALAFSRNRSIQGGDFTRSFHQGMVIAAGLRGAQERGILDLPDLLALLSGFTWTDLPAGDLLTLAAGAYELDPAAVANLVLPGSVGTVGAASVVLLSPEDEAVYRDLDDGVITPGSGRHRPPAGEGTTAGATRPKPEPRLSRRSSPAPGRLELVGAEDLLLELVGGGGDEPQRAEELVHVEVLQRDGMAVGDDLAGATDAPDDALLRRPDHLSTFFG